MPCLRIFLALLFFPGCSPAQENARVEDRRPQDATESAWVDLDSPTSSARDAARKKIEAQPLRVWKSRALAETRPWASIEALLALCQACPLSEVESNAALGRSLGRDHHPQAFSMWLAGGGIKPGVTLGATDELGFHVVENPVHVHDLQATILHLLGSTTPD